MHLPSLSDAIEPIWRRRRHLTLEQVDEVVRVRVCDDELVIYTKGIYEWCGHTHAVLFVYKA